MIFCFARNIAFYKIQRCCRQIWQKFFFSNFSWKYPHKAFWVSNSIFFLFWKKLCSRTNSRVLVSNMKVFSKIEVQWIFCPKFLDFYFCRKLCFDKFERPDFKYGNRFSKLQPKNTLARPFWSRTWKLFHCTKLYLLKYLSVQASNKTILFSNSRLKNLNKAFLFLDFFLFRP